MNFTYDAYRNLLNLLKEKNYSFGNYFNYTANKKVVILRHDIDTSIEAAVRMAQIEADAGVKATYFVLLSTNFYNVASSESLIGMKEIVNLGGEIGLHFDETKYAIQSDDDIVERIQYESHILSQILEMPIRSVSMHRPSKGILEKNIEIPGVINSYGKVFFDEFKYVSDSRRFWREDVCQLIKQDVCDRMHILTHPFWYHDIEIDFKNSIIDFCRQKTYETYDNLCKNMRDLQSEVQRTDLNIDD